MVYIDKMPEKLTARMDEFRNQKTKTNLSKQIKKIVKCNDYVNF